MWINNCIRATLILLPFAGASTLQACEIGSLTLQPATTQKEYDVFSTSQYATINTYRVQAEIYGETCQLGLILALDDASQALENDQQHRLKFEWSGQVGTAVGHQWHMTLTDKKNAATVQLRFPSQQWLSAGSYQGELELSLADDTLESQESPTPSSLRINVNVPPAAKIHYYGLSEQHVDLNFGELHSNKVINSAPNLWIQSNTGYRIMFVSANRGKLRHESDNPKWDIPYQLTLDNDPVMLSSEEAHLNFQQSTMGQPAPMSFMIGDFFEKPGGRYQDTLEISIEPQMSQKPYF